MRLVSVCVLAVALLSVATPAQARECLFERLFQRLAERVEARRVQSGGSTGGYVQSGGSTGGYVKSNGSDGGYVSGGSNGGGYYSVPQRVAVEIVPLSSGVYEDNCPNCVK